MEVGGEVDYTPIVTLSPPENDTRIKMGSDESHFIVSIGSDVQSHRTVSTNHNLFLKRNESRSGIEPRSFRLPAYRQAKPAHCL